MEVQGPSKITRRFGTAETWRTESGYHKWWSMGQSRSPGIFCWAHTLLFQLTANTEAHREYKKNLNFEFKYFKVQQHLAPMSF